MPSNAEAADLFREIADLLDLNGERFKPEAYRRAARSIETLTEDLTVVSGRGGLREIPGVGEAIAEKIREYLQTGRIAYLERLRTEVPGGLVSLMRLPGLGPKTARRFWLELGVEGPAELRDAIEASRLSGVAGFGPRKIEQISAALENAPRGGSSARFPIEAIYAVARGMVETLQERAVTDRVEVAGSFRRGRETVGDLDILVTSRDPANVFEVFSSLPEVADVKMRGGTKETVVLTAGLQVDLRVVEPESFGAALQYFTGSKDHNVRLRGLARERGLKVNEYGVFRGEERVAGRTEEEVYGALGLRWIPPELREDRGEIDAAAKGALPSLVERTDLIGELHLHLPEEASPATVARLTDDARSRGLEYVGVVVASYGTDGRVSTIAPELRASIRNASGAVRWLSAVELPPGPLPEGMTGVAADYRILRPGAVASAPLADNEKVPPVGLVAHVGPDPVVARPWLEFARATGAPVEVGPGAERIDSSLARSVQEAKGLLAVPTGLGAPSRDPTAPVGLALARRAGASARQVANARPWAGRRLPGRRARPTSSRPR